MLFKEYIESCESDIIVEMNHLNEVTFENICTLIKLIIIKNKKVILSDEVKQYLGHSIFEQSTSVELKKVKNGEELMLLLHISDGLYLDQSFEVDILWDANNDGKYTYYPKYKMSNKFVLAAKQHGISKYPCVKKIICNFNMF